MYGNWVIARGSSIGGRHIEENLPCQDSNGVYYSEEKKYGVAIVSDGAGSADHSDLGSKVVVEKGILIINECLLQTPFEELINMKQLEIESFFVDFYKMLYKEFETFSIEHNLQIKSLAATSIVVLFNESCIVCSHIGDGRAGYQDSQGNWHAILEPFKGDAANQTIFITSDIWTNPYEFIRTNKVNDRIQSFTLMSDGCENATFELNRFNEETQLYMRLNNPFPGFFNPNVAILRELNSQGIVTSEIDELWLKFLQKGNTKFETEIDDKTLVLGTLKDFQSNA
jgi:hypothetical protein